MTVKFTGGTPTAVATQIGSGSFTAAILSSNSLTLSVPSGTTNFTVAYVCTGVSGSINIATVQHVIEASTEDGTSFSESCPSTSTVSTGTLTGSIDASAIPGANYVGVEAAGDGTGLEYLLLGDTATFSESMPAGTDRAAAAGYIATSSQGVLGSPFTLVAARNFESATIPGALNGGNTVTLGAADEVTQEPITYEGVPSGFSAPTTSAFFLWSGDGGLLLANPATTSYPAVPAGAAESGDYYSFASMTDVVVQSSSSTTGLGGQEVFVDTTTTAAGPLTVKFPSPWSYSGPTPAAQPTFDMSNSGITGTTGLTETGELGWSVEGVGSVSEFGSSVVATGNYQNGSTTLTFPDLSGVTGFLAPPSSGTMVQWDAKVSLSSKASLQSQGDNGTTTGVLNGGTFTVP